MKTLALILVGLSLSLNGCYRCSYGWSAYCEDSAYSEEGKKYEAEYKAKLAKQEADKKAAAAKVNHK
jgi:hypothetical protein